MSTTVSKPAQPNNFGTGDVIGRCELIDGWNMQGWAVRLGSPLQKIEMVVKVGDAMPFFVKADGYRSDIAPSGIGDGHCGFGIDLRSIVSPGDHMVYIFDRSTRTLILGSPFSFTLRPETGIVGEVERVSIDRITGHAYDPVDLDAALEIVFNIDGKPIGRTRADQHRRGLLERGIGSGNYGFEFVVSAEYREDAFMLEVQAGDARASLAGSPITFAPADEYWLRLTALETDLAACQERIACLEAMIRHRTDIDLV